jgi:hypothetical protein
MRVSAGVFLVVIACSLLPAQSPVKKSAAATKKAAPVDPAPDPKLEPKLEPGMHAATLSDKLTYEVEWRLIHAGTALIESQRNHAELRLESAGMVSSLFKVHDLYTVNYDDGFCATAATMDSQEGKRHHDTKVTYDRAANRASYLERDLLANVTLHSDSVSIPNCVHEVLGAFLKIRELKITPGQTVQLPMSDGRKSASVRMDGQAREEIKTAAGTFQTVRVEANMMNGVVYTRKGKVLLWISDDERHLPVQIRLRMPFPIGSVTLQLAKEEHP